jgi:hypothetical protein
LQLQLEQTPFEQLEQPLPRCSAPNLLIGVNTLSQEFEEQFGQTTFLATSFMPLMISKMFLQFWHL